MRSALVFGGVTLSTASTLRLQINPVTRVAELLENLAKKLEADGKDEKKLYAKYQCWCTTVQKDKAASIAAASDRITELENYVAELDSGRVEMTDERSTLESEIQGLKEDILELDNTRSKDKKTFEKNEDETEKAIAALTAALAKLDSAIDGNEEGVFFELSKGMVHLIRRSQDALSEQDARFLEEILSDADPNAQGTNWDHKKLNRKATFKMGYKARSQKIRQILADMKTDFEHDLTSLRDAETKAIADHTDLRASRDSELTTAVDAKNSAAEEGAARAKSKQDSEDEAADLRAARTDDERFVSQTRSSCAAKATEFDARAAARKEEIAAVHEAVSILRSDDARDTFKKSFDSQSFVQESSVAVPRKQLALAARTLRMTHTSSLRLDALATFMTQGKSFAEVIEKIDDMVVNLRKEQDDDLKDKHDCDEQRKTNTIAAKERSQTIDKNNARIEELKAENSRLQQQIKDTEAEIAEAQEAKRDATSQREAEAAEFAASKLDDETAKSLVEQAHGVLQTRMQALAESSALIQAKSKQTPGGEAPPPPPATFEGSYGGAQGEANGILAILMTIKEDIEHDMAKAQKEEDDSIASYDALVADLTGAITEKRNMITTMEGEIADNDTDIGDKETEVTNDEGTLQGTLDLLKQITPGCDFIAANYDLRAKNRNLEIDGLKKAKAVLLGAEA